jgi:hypothetical protein
MSQVPESKRRVEAIAAGKKGGLVASSKVHIHTKNCMVDLLPANTKDFQNGSLGVCCGREPLNYPSKLHHCVHYFNSNLLAGLHHGP